MVQKKNWDQKNIGCDAVEAESRRSLYSDSVPKTNCQKDGNVSYRGSCEQRQSAAPPMATRSVALSGCSMTRDRRS